MGVFARLLGRSKAAPEASDAAAGADTEPAAAPAGTEPDVAEAAEQADRTESAEPRGAGAAKVTEAAGDGREDVAVRSDAGPDDAAEGTGIPRQQSAGAAADSEAGEGARR
ncbi:hypothetical protein GCM10010521_55990 [Streptomyces rameus]|uniref:Gliding motility protein n=1 Tax=Streptomyces rameus TaxID=68261 RepID=A0ABN3UZ19_9ACTN